MAKKKIAGTDYYIEDIVYDIPAPVVQYEVDPEAIHLWWVSFVKTSPPTFGPKHPGAFLGAVIVEAMNKEEALAETHLAGLNPGGEAAIVFIPPAEHWRVKPGEKYRLLDREESLQFDKRKKP